ncbi:MAG: putative inorganic carbon transporter subunit DabA [Balneolaceae bacterium]|nr:putative inorganic carbon transporter subunit DabA [Balneolaceae bacterium]
MKKDTITASIQALSKQLPNNWPLYSFVTSNPLAGFEDLPFKEAVSKFRKNIGINGYPSAETFKQAWKKDEIDRKVLEKQLQDSNITLGAEDSLSQMRQLESHITQNHLLGEVDRHIIKWLTVFLDEGSTEWGLPNRDSGFFKAWRSVARFDRRLPNRQILSSLPEKPLEVIHYLTASFEPDDLDLIFKHHLFALPGWVGYIKFRIENSSEWQNSYPITLEDYLAVRLTLCFMLDKDLMPATKPDQQHHKELDQLKLAWLTAMEYTYRNKLINQVKNQTITQPNGSNAAPDAQFVFCIDTRSERIRRAVEKAGNYETFGYAGFFGVSMDYIHPEKEIRHKSCPPILEAELQATEQVRPEDASKSEKFDYFNNLKKAIDNLRFSLKNNIPASFGYVESTGFFYALAMLNSDAGS